MLGSLKVSVSLAAAPQSRFSPAETEKQGQA